MSPAVVLAIVVASQNVDDQATEAMRATAAEALGSADAVVVRAVEVPSDSEALRIERLVHSQTAAQVVWLDAAHTRARLRVHAVETGRWIERTIAFSSVDTSVERGRALGFALTSMLPEETLAANPHRRTARPPVPSMTADGDYGTSVRAGGAGSLGLGGNALGGGAAVAGEFYVTPTWLVRLSLSVRFGNVPKLANASDWIGYAGLGVAYWPMRPSPGRALTFGVRADALALVQRVKGSSETEEPQATNVRPGLDALGELAWNVGASVEIVGSAGVEVALLGTVVELDGVRKDVIPIVRAVGELGIRVSF